MSLATSEILENNILGFDKEKSKTKVVVAMSGGVDSSVVAAILKKQGYDVIGITLQLFDYGKIGKSRGTCCAGKDIYDAKRVCDQLDIKHEVFNYESIFREEVIEKFAESYVNGETPVPCIDCNQTVKFRDLFKSAKNLDADALATGHYVKRVFNSCAKMYRPEDLNRDQSYFLFNTTQEQLNFLRFPLGSLSKSMTRNIARDLNLQVANKPDSQDICFVPNGNYKTIIEKLKPEAFNKGDILNIKGNVVGKHNGIANFTIGQRKGIKVSSSEPYFVINIDSKKNEVVVGSRDDLLVKNIFLKNINLLCKSNELIGNFFVKVRSTGNLISCKILNEGKKIVLDKGEAGVSPGQACVFYKRDDLGTRIFGGGWIELTSK
ncbi:MAG: tRNA 2-thiouridine(34) synthase MnmA [Pelagibacteraceae bacterium TMED136]|nr:MAG: tRNA 2-thiouridine(34) synthase MnmA [Pelagibacteraceae bacterium TMED136]|tara:strand:- start:3851 stop:4984 length:1134 start_codon:yes stop_codon:yes gene_type:complete